MEKTLGLILAITVAASGCISLNIDRNLHRNTHSAKVAVIGVIDGDTIDVKIDSREDTVRLKGVDTPEVHTDNSPEEYEGIPDTEESRGCLENWGENASRYLEKKIGGENITLRYSLDRGEPERGYYGRIIGKVLHENVSINRQLVIKGYARSYSEEGPYAAEEVTARENSAGLWKCQNPS